MNDKILMKIVEEDDGMIPLYALEDIRLCCPDCGAAIDYKEECVVILVRSPSSDSHSRYAARLKAVCTKCGSHGKEPGIK